LWEIDLIKELIIKNRSYRRFYEDKLIKINTLKELVNLARLSPSGGNLQRLRYILSNTKEQNDEINKHIFWAAYYKDWEGPIESEKPSAYIVVVKDDNLKKDSSQDEGIAVQSILLGAVELGLGGCIIANIDKEKLAESLNLSKKYKIALVLALGYPKEKVLIENINESEDVKYWRDENEVHHVPKITLDDLIL
jgi:nitroreductase